MRRWLSGKRTKDSERYSAAVEELLSAPADDMDVPDPSPWNPLGTDAERILLVPAADYHLDELVPLSQELDNRGFETVFAVGKSPWERTKRGIARYPNLSIHWLPAPEALAGDVRLVVTLKDTGSMTEWVTAVRASGIPVIGKVEGAQDFWDSDTPEERRPYRNLDLVLCQGQFDADALSGVETAIVGSSRLERLWRAPPPPKPDVPMALINLNFVYGVRTADRKTWLITAVEGANEAGIEPLVSVHPAEKSGLGPNMTKVSASKLLPFSSVLISRFSTMPFEAMVRGVPFVYHNPHHETVATFAQAHGAFPTTRTASELRDAISIVAEKERSREAVHSYIQHHIDMELDRPSEVRSADVLEEAYIA